MQTPEERVSEVLMNSAVDSDELDIVKASYQGASFTFETFDGTVFTVTVKATN